MNTDEEWRQSPSFPNYWASDHGRVRSPSGKILKYSARKPHQRKWRPRVGIWIEGKRQTLGIHTVVADAFTGPRPPGLVIAHWDGNVENNTPDNLRYCLPVENCADQFRHGTNPQGIRNGQHKLTEAQVIQIRQMKDIPSMQGLARDLGVSVRALSLLLAGETWKHLLPEESHV